ncbi:hypothetical protein HELRODRAFT_189939 [Helobdella robusta]|uniref:FCH domain-containing protein n=1 Tax=Helobdella robusta TaxID=6412 RepID=T1FRI3_HELRO|nr:hypothetical protein HELRODRAFT_189939 [Helobdella robusta]ESN90669.1 hypothetical protein HELRODRAFT_189939 [Helobdella robusta]
MASPDKKLPLKFIFSEHNSRLQQRLRCETQIIDDLKSFMKQKSAIEKEYGQAMMKLTQLYASKLPQCLLSKGSYKVNGFENSILLTTAWRNYLNELEEANKIRIHNTDAYMHRMSEMVKLVKLHRSQSSKLVFENLSDRQKEAYHSIADSMKTYKQYKEKQQKTNECRMKMKTLNMRVKSNASKHQQQHSQLSNELRTCESVSDKSRNDYIMSLAAANQHLLDGDFYEDWKNFLTWSSESDIQTYKHSIKSSNDVIAAVRKVPK